MLRFPDIMSPLGVLVHLLVMSWIIIVRCKRSWFSEMTSYVTFEAEPLLFPRSNLSILEPLLLRWKWKSSSLRTWGHDPSFVGRTSQASSGTEFQETISVSLRDTQAYEQSVGCLFSISFPLERCSLSHLILRASLTAPHSWIRSRFNLFFFSNRGRNYSQSV